MKRFWITLIVLFMATTAMFAQDKNPKMMAQERMTYMREHTSFTQKESQEFWKVYEQFLKEEMKVMDTYRKNLAKQGIKLGAPGTNKDIIANLSDKQLTYLQDQKFEMRKNLLNLETSYHKKYKAILTPKHLQELYNTEYAYKKEMTKKKKEAKKEVQNPVNTGKKKR